MDKNPAVYILTNKQNKVLYIGVTGDLKKRVWEHKEKLIKGFTNKYNTNKLVYFEIHKNMKQAIKKEKKIKKWNRKWKIEMIERDNPKWKDLYCDLA